MRVANLQRPSTVVPLDGAALVLSPRTAADASVSQDECDINVENRQEAGD